MPAVFGQAGIEHMRKYGTKMEHFAKISVKSHQHATKNPFSQYRNEVTLEDVTQRAHDFVSQHAVYVLPDR